MDFPPNTLASITPFLFRRRKQTLLINNCNFAFHLQILATYLIFYDRTYNILYDFIINKKGDLA